uniref:Uncharacterized protein n=1 Tax=Octopus bimaculoides TaxID=37653 RepID=A0A0L8I989_OCTBM
MMFSSQTSHHFTIKLALTTSVCTRASTDCVSKITYITQNNPAIRQSTKNLLQCKEY